MNEGKHRTVAEMIMNDPYFEGTGDFRSYRNSPYRADNLHINRSYLREECRLLLDNQREFYPEQLTEQNTDAILKIAFEQRCFEDGSGNPAEDEFRRYGSFLDTIGKCRFLPDVDRGCRFTVLADLFSLVNTLSQYRYLTADNEEAFTGALAKDLINYTLMNGKIEVKNVKAIAKKHRLTVNTSFAETKGLDKCQKFIKVIKKIFDECSIEWSPDILQKYGDAEFELNELGELLSKNLTPRRRISMLKSLGRYDERTISLLAAQRFSGTCSVSNEYMRGAIDAFLQGELYGKHQAEVVKSIEKKRTSEVKASYKLPSFESSKKDFEFYKNPVVCRAINEARKIIRVN